MSASSFNPTPEQLAAIGHRDGAAIVSAAAGSGKTAVLVERVMKLLLDEEKPVNADELIITTFTVKAAGEMKERLMKRLEEAVRENPDNDRLSEQMWRLNDAVISTINSFCLGLLKKNSAVLGISPDFTIADEAEARLYFARALDLTLEDFCEKGKKKERRLIYDRFCGENDSRLAEVISALYNFSRSLAYPEKYFDYWLSVYESGEYPSELARDFFEKVIAKEADKISALCEKLGEACGDRDTFAEVFANYNEATDLLRSTAAENADIGKILESCTSHKFKNTPKGHNSEDVKNIRDKIKNCWNKALSRLSVYPRMSSDLKQEYPVLKILLYLVGELDKNFTKIKRSKNKLDFTDVELTALDMLRDENGEPSAIAREIAASASIIIVDEFQDSNEIQYEIFRLISRDKSNLYFVGDVKQSIYGFRGADPSVFTRLAESGEYKVLTLNRNFRSSDKVVDAVNGVFRGTMTKALGGVDYGDDCALVHGSNNIADDEHCAELIRIQAQDIGTARAEEAAYIACRIKEMVEGGFTVTEKGGEKRPCGYGDFAVLMGRYSNVAHIYKKVFREAGLPVDAKEDENYTDFREIKLMLSLLRVIDDPYNDIELATVMMCPPYLFTPDEMSEIKLSGGREHGSLFSGLKAFSRRNEKAESFLCEIEHYRDLAAESTTEQLIRALYDISPLIPAMRASKNGERRDTNLRKLISYAAAFGQRSGGSLYDFLNYMETLKNKNVKLVQAGGEQDRSSVKLMTIHSSKGLEFPVCIIANLSSDTKEKGVKTAQCSRKYGVGLSLVEPDKMLESSTVPQILAANEVSDLERSEAVRLLYVALTRAKDKLIITAPLVDLTKSEAHYGFIMNSSAVKSGLIRVSAPIRGFKPDRSRAAELYSQNSCELGDFSEYPDARLCRIPAKVTATQIGVKSVDDFIEYDDKMTRFMGKPSFLQSGETGRLTGKKLGDAYHKAMERLDLSLGGESASKQLDALLAEGRLSETERLSINDEAVAAFLDSEICRRAAKSTDTRREYPVFCEFDTRLGSLIPDGSILLGIKDDDSEKPFIQGVVDMFFVEEDGIVLVDYKSNRVTAEEQLIEEYRGQLAVYAFALGQMTGKRVKECMLYSFYLKRGISVKL